MPFLAKNPSRDFDSIFGMDNNSGDLGLSCQDAIAILTLPGLETAMVSRDFAVHFDHELSHEWKLFDPFGKVHVVYYQSDLENPELYKGLLEIRSYYSLEGLNWFLLKYQGSSNFDLYIYNENIEEVCYIPRPPTSMLNPLNTTLSLDISPNIVSLPTANIAKQTTWICYPCFFTCKLSLNQATSSALNLPLHVTDFLRNSKVYNWLLRGPSAVQIECRILGVPNGKYAKFGMGWRAFCRSHDLKEGDVLTFYFTSEMFGVIDVKIHAATN